MNNKVYFPPCGFGFWYQFGILDSLSEKDLNIYGSSAGSLICLIYLLDEEDRDVLKILDDCKKIGENISKKGIIQFFNTYNYTSNFCNYIIDKIKNYSPEKINNKLLKINIEVTKIRFKYNIPYLESKFINPTNLEELRNYVIASCYIPLFSYYKSFFYYKYKNEYFIDGAFGNLTNRKIDCKIINSHKYGSIIPCDDKYALVMYKEGLKFDLNNQEEINKFSIIYFFIYLKNILVNLFNLLHKNVKRLIKI